MIEVTAMLYDLLNIQLETWLPHLTDLQRQEVMYSLVPGLETYQHNTEVLYACFCLAQREPLFK